MVEEMKVSKNRDYIKKEYCSYCRSTEKLTVDHKIPLVQGGSNEIDNLQTLCYRCNSLKSGLSHKQLMNIWRWHTEINRLRALAGKKSLATDMLRSKYK